MNAAAYFNTTNWKFGLFWPTQGTKRDWDFGNRVGVWVQKNEKVLNKKPPNEAIRLVAEEFPDVCEVDVRDYANRGMRWAK